MTHRDPQDEQLTRLLKAAGPDSLPGLEPDPLLPTRVRALARERVQLRLVEARHPWPRWARVSLGAAAVALAVATGGYLGYSAGTTYASAAVMTADTDASPDSDELLLNALAQSGFAEDLQQWSPAGEVGE